MGISCGASLIKYILFAFNLIWVGLGAAVLYFGIRVLLKFTTDVSDVIKQTPSIPAIVLLVTGGAIFFVGFLGCCGAIKESSCMLNTYGIIIFLLLVAQAVGAYFILTYHKDFTVYATEGIKSAMHGYDWNKSSDEPGNKAINEFQKQLSCCGAESYKDWDEIREQQKPELKDSYPPSCCGNATDANKQGNCPAVKVHKIGCIAAIESQLKMLLGSMGFIAIAIGVIQLLIILAACCLAREARYGGYAHANPK